jgi:(S)-2-hydroxyglutarate dehydrogenase
MLLDFCEKEEIKYDLCGKIVVATRPEQISILDGLFERGKQNGLDGFKMLNAEQIKEYEPHVVGLKGFFVPQTGIIDYTDVCKKYLAKTQKLGGEIAFGEKVESISSKNNISTGRHSVVVTSKGSYETKLVVNCAGLYSDKVGQMTDSKADNLKIIPFRGEYFEIKPEKQYLVKNLIYPVPDPNFPFLGVHFTRMIHGGVEAGPNAVLAFRREGYKKLDVHFGELFETLGFRGFQKVAMKYWQTGLGEMYRSFSKAAFTKALQELIPEIQSDDLVAGAAGVRAQACDREGGLLDDFAIFENQQAINVCNAPSPAATSSLSIGQTVSELVLKRF